MFRSVFFIITIFLTYSLFSIPPKKQPTDTDIKNLIICIESENEGVRSWGVYFAGKYKVKKAVIPLMRVLHEDNNPQIRKLAAYSLYRIGDNRGLFSLKGSSKFDDSPEVRMLCNLLYKITSN